MRRTTVRFLAPFGAVVLFGAFVLSLLGPSAAQADPMTPFKASYTSAITFTSPTTATLAGQGNASHLGNTVTAGSLAQTGPGSCSGGFLAEIHDTLNAANGDTVGVTVDLQACPTAPGIYQGTGTYVITGGTGQFAGASGSGAFSGLGDFNTGTVHCMLDGTISK